MQQGRQLVVMVRWPAPGRCKSRLAQGLGSTRAADVQQRLSDHTMAVARRARQRVRFELVLAVQGLGPRATRRWAAFHTCDRALSQGHGSLGVRMRRQFTAARQRGGQQVVIVGSDLPSLTVRDLELAFDGLDHHPLVLGPAADGGYWLIGLNRDHPDLFCGIAWGTDAVLDQTRAAAARLGLKPHWLSCRNDVDYAADLAPWR